ncbi:MAG: response regulator transcription factor [Bacteroidales bacterium]|nr:response regulator transcription factor [Bacteroidales bacterium]
MTCIAIDDEPLALKQLSGYIKKTPFLTLSGTFSSATEADNFLKDNPVSLIVTDINMPDTSGLDFIKNLQEPPLVIFSTAYEEYALDGFKVDAIDYLLKPYGYNDFLKAATKARQYIEWREAAVQAGNNSSDDDFIFVRADNQSVKVMFNSILYVEAMSEYIKIHFKEGKSVMTFMSVKLMSESLPANQFMRIHRSYIIALDSIASVRRGEVELTDGTVLPISASYKEDLQKFINDKSVSRKNAKE